MEDKIEVREYVRTKDGYIIKVDENTNIFNLGYKEQYVDMETTKYGFTCEQEIVKHSKQLIDLIENKDVLKVRIDKTIMVFGMDEDTSDIKYKELIENIENGEYELLEILTHEQFEANCYKVGGEDE